MKGRALHFVFKVADRTLTARFYREILGMKILRHEEFTQGCEAACNGPYDNRWSKTMVGYGPEDTHFVVELTYNYNVNNYELGNDFQGITIKSRESIARAKANNWPIEAEGGVQTVVAPGGYKFFLEDEPEPKDRDPVQKVTLSCSDLKNSIDYWNRILGLEIVERDQARAVFGFDKNQAQLELKLIDTPVTHETAYGRIAFSVPREELVKLEEDIKKEDHKILVPLVSLDTPGKATVIVIILADPDGHEICFVDDENFRKLSEVDPQGELLLDRYIKKDEDRKKV